MVGDGVELEGAGGLSRGEGRKIEGKNRGEGRRGWRAWGRACYLLLVVISPSPLPPRPISLSR